MSYYVEIVCDRCATSPGGHHVEPGQAFARRLNRKLPKGWRHRVGVDGRTVHLCVECLDAAVDQPATSVDTETEGEGR